MKEICVVDISHIGNKNLLVLNHLSKILGLARIEPTTKDLEIVGKELSLAFSKIGFVYLSGHGIAESTVEDAMKISKTFFELGESKKSNISRPNPLARDGWVAPGRETFVKVSHGFLVFHLMNDTCNCRRKRGWSMRSGRHLTSMVLMNHPGSQKIFQTSS